MEQDDFESADQYDAYNQMEADSAAARKPWDDIYVQTSKDVEREFSYNARRKSLQATIDATNWHVLGLNAFEGRYFIQVEHLRTTLRASPEYAGIADAVADGYLAAWQEHNFDGSVVTFDDGECREENACIIKDKARHLLHSVLKEFEDVAKAAFDKLMEPHAAMRTAGLAEEDAICDAYYNKYPN